MPDTTGSLTRRAAAAACLTLAFALPAAAQIPQPVAVPAPAGYQFLPRFDFYFTMASLRAEKDPAERFWWDTHYGGSFDIVDYKVGRAAVLNYILEASLSARARETEIVGVFHHVSRHLSDRPKDFAIAWNALGGRLLRRVTSERATLDVDLDIGRVVRSSFVDYRWIMSLDLRVERQVHPRVGVFAHGQGQVITVDGSVDRGTQTGGLVEGGLRLGGDAAILELFLGYENRVDAYPLERIPRHWGLVGFRLLSKQ
jgi:hypothetical protein